MKIIFFTFLLVVSIFSSGATALLEEEKGTYKYNLMFNEIYTTSAKYTSTDTTSLNTSVPCYIVDTTLQDLLRCKNSEFSCPCTSGELIDLTPNKIYLLEVRNDDNVIANPVLKTASIGEISWSFGVTSISYNISYNNGDTIPPFCSSSISRLQSKERIISESVDECLGGTFRNLTSNSSYILNILNNDAIMHEITTYTGTFDLNVTSVGMQAFSYNVSTNVDFEQSICDVVDVLSSMTLLCNGIPCECLRDVITDLPIDSDYLIQFSRDGHFLTEFSIKTGSNGTLSYIPTYNGLNFTVEYDDDKAIPGHCYPCTWDTYYGDVTIEECWEFIFERVFREVHCTRFRYEDLTQQHYFKTILFDSFGAIIGALQYSYVPKSEIIHTSYELKSISYKLDSEMEYNPNYPCYILNSQESKRMCQVNGINTTDCPCEEGKMIDLTINAYIWVELYQDGKLLAKDERMYTADNGSPYLNSIGLQHFEYIITYYYNTHPPYQCLACLTEYSLNVEDCPTDVSVFGRSICRTYLFDTLKNATQYRLRIFDADHYPHTHGYAWTVGVPVSADFADEDDFVTYRLTFLNSSVQPFSCIFYFEEDPSIVQSCSDSKCSCLSGKIQVPLGTSYRKLVIADDAYQILARRVLSSSGAALNVGTIIGICIFALLIITIIVVTVLIILVRKRVFKPKVYDQF